MKHYIAFTKTYKSHFLLQKLFERYKRPLCHDSATIYLQFNSKLDSHIIIYHQMDGKKKKNILCVQRESLHLAYLLVFKLVCFANSFPMST